MARFGKGYSKNCQESYSCLLNFMWKLNVVSHCLTLGLLPFLLAFVKFPFFFFCLYMVNSAWVAAPGTLPSLLKLSCPLIFFHVIWFIFPAEYISLYGFLNFFSSFGFWTPQGLCLVHFKNLKSNIMLTYNRK